MLIINVILSSVGVDDIATVIIVIVLGMNSIKWEIWILQKAWGVRKTHLTWATIQGEVGSERLMKKLLAHRGVAISFAHWGLERKEYCSDKRTLSTRLAWMRKKQKRERWEHSTTLLNKIKLPFFLVLLKSADPLSGNNNAELSNSIAQCKVSDEKP